MTVFGTLRRFSGGDRARLYDFRRRREDPGEHPRGRLRGRSGHQALSIAETASLGARRAPATSQRGQQGNALHRDSATGLCNRRSLAKHTSTVLTNAVPGTAPWPYSYRATLLP